ncbi:MAG: DUF6134 family protein [Dongiaceae bacterium]
MRTIGRLIALLVTALVALPAAAETNELAALASFPPTGRLEYQVIRDGDEIGTQSVEFIRKDDSLTVRTRVNIAVTMLGITVYRFTHAAEEQWQNGQLTAFASKSNDDGEPRDVALKREGDRLRGTYNRRTVDLPATRIPASLWHPATVHQTILLDPIKGRDRQVAVVDKGMETIKVKGQPIQAHRYAMSGQIVRDIWYGPDGQIVQVRLPGKDGSQIQLVLR